MAITCQDKHNFISIGPLYAKYIEIDKSGQQPKLYTVIYCSQCGETKEIVAIDRGDIPEGFNAGGDNIQNLDGVDTPNL